mgnify:CR=1 FL=1
MLKNKLLSFYVKQQIKATEVWETLQNKDGSVTGDMGIWVFIICAVGLLIVGLLVNYVRDNGFPALVNRLEEIMNFS